MDNAPHIWSAYAITAALLLALILTTWARARRVRARSASHEA